ncbi:MAG: ATP-binding protein [Holophagales bacterium]|nr:ATP-binding protein [Holophagales bacterium]MYF95073.1 ATP-binding protein [Holophagales bacterium]
MKFRFNNLGPVKATTLELGDLTLIAGRNNTGKTYTVYTLYGFLKMWRSSPFAVRRAFRESRDLFPELRAFFDQLVLEGSATWEPDDDALARNRAAFAKHLARYFSKHHLAGVFSSKQEDFARARLTLDLGDIHPKEAYETTVPLPGRAALAFEFDGGSIVASLSGTRHEPRLTPAIETAVIQEYARLLLDHLLPDPFILSAERFGISLFYKDLDYRRNQLVDALQKEQYRKDRDSPFPYWLLDETTSRYSLPVKDNIDYTRSLPDLKNDRSDLHDDKFFNDIKDLLGGYYSNASQDLRFISKSRKTNHFNIPLHLASSSARGLSDLYFYLKHVAKRQQLLIIDEPESHLDTANQVRLARLLARMVGAGLRILVTTHSDYLVKEVNNLVMLSQLKGKDRALLRKLAYTEADQVRPRQLRAYVAEDGGLSACSVDQYGADLPVFDRTIDAINRTANELAARLPLEAEE